MLKQFFSVHSAIGIGLKIHADESFTINVCQITRDSNQLNFDQKLTGLSSLKALAKEIPNKTPVALNISGKGVLIKRVAKLTEITAANFAQLLPNAKFEDFYIQNFISGDQSFVSIIRQNEADIWLDRLSEIGYNVVILSIGPFPIEHVLPQLSIYNEEVIFDGHIIQRDEHKHWIDYKSNNSSTASFPLKLESEKIDEKLLLAYSAAFQLLLKDKLNIIEASNSKTGNNLKQTLTLIWIRAYGAMVLVVSFVLLLINFLLYTHYEEVNANLSLRVSKYARNTSDIDSTKEKIIVKERKLKILGWDGAINKAALIDQLASDLPSDIIWKEIQINPIDQNGSRVQKALTFYDRQIKVIGLSQQIIPVNEWMARIKIKPWVKSVKLESYSQNNELNTGQFLLTITF